jgi:hypothetical protein
VVQSLGTKRSKQKNAATPSAMETRDMKAVSQRQREDEALAELKKAKLRRMALAANLRRKRLAAEAEST